MKRSLIDIYKLLGDKPLHEQEDIETYDSPSGELHRVDHSKNEEKVEIEIPGIEGKTEVKITHPAADDDRALQGVTIEFNGETYSDIEFEAEDMIEDHENEGQDWIFIAEGDGMAFEVEVQVEASYQESGRIQAINWESLTVTYDDMYTSTHRGEELEEELENPKKADLNKDGKLSSYEKTRGKAIEKNIDEQGCTEQEIREGTCGYAPDGDIDVHNTAKHKPAGSHLLKISLQEARMIRRFKKLAGIKKKK